MRAKFARNAAPSDLRVLVRGLRLEGPGPTLRRALLAARRRGVGLHQGAVMSDVSPDAPLAWRRHLSAIYSHYLLGIGGRLPWLEEEVLRDVKRISSLSEAPRSAYRGDGTQVALVGCEQVRCVLATLETLRTWPDSNRLRVVVLRPGDDDECAWGTLASVPGVDLFPGTLRQWARDSAARSDADRVALLMRSGDLPVPGWAEGLVFQLQRPGIRMAVGGSLSRSHLLSHLPMNNRLPRSRQAQQGDAASSVGVRIEELVGTAWSPSNVIGGHRSAIDATVVVCPSSPPTSALPPSIGERPRERGHVVIVAPLPRTDQDSGSQDVYWIVRHAADLGYGVTFVQVGVRTDDASYVWELRRLGVRVMRVREGRLNTRDLRMLSNVLSHADACIAVFHFSAAEVMRCIEDSGHPIPVLFVPLDLLHLSARSRQTYAGAQPSAVLSHELERTELEMVRRCTMTAVISDVEAKYLADIGLGRTVRSLPMLRTAPDRSHLGPVDGSPMIVFVGGFKHGPNRDSLRWVVERVWPLVVGELQDAHLTVFGSNLSEVCAAALRKIPRVHVYGRFASEWEPYAGDAIALAPLVHGGGVKGKVVTALAHGAPVVGTSFAVQGLPEDLASCVSVNDDAQSFASSVVRIATDAKRREAIRQQAIAAYDRNFSEEAGRAAVRDLLQSIMSQGRL